jgi:hypothetical protein
MFRGVLIFVAALCVIAADTIAVAECAESTEDQRIAKFADKVSRKGSSWNCSGPTDICDRIVQGTEVAERGSDVEPEEQESPERVYDSEQKDRWGQNFIAAVRKDDLAEVIALLDKGARVTGKNEYYSSALMIAADQGQSAIVKLLLEKGADVNAKTGMGWTALMDASDRGYLEVARLLLDQEADINANTSDGWTALMLAVDAGHPKIVRLLLEKGAEVNAKTARGTSALKMAQDKGYKEIEDMLKAHGAKETPGSEDANQSGRPVK